MKIESTRKTSTRSSKFFDRLNNNLKWRAIETKKIYWEILRHVYSKQQPWICITWPSFLLTCALLFITSSSKWVKKLHVSFVYNNCFGLFLAARFLFWEILNLNLTFAVCRKRYSKSLFYHNYERREKTGLKCLSKNNIQLQFTSHFLRRAAAVSSELCKI